MLILNGQLVKSNGVPTHQPPPPFWPYLCLFDSSFCPSQPLLQEHRVCRWRFIIAPIPSYTSLTVFNDCWGRPNNSMHTRRIPHERPKLRRWVYRSPSSCKGKNFPPLQEDSLRAPASSLTLTLFSHCLRSDTDRLYN